MTKFRLWPQNGYLRWNKSDRNLRSRNWESSVFCGFLCRHLITQDDSKNLSRE